MLPAKSSISYDEELQNLREEGFDQEQIELLTTYRDRYTDGTYKDDAPEQRRLEFFRWLYQHGKMEE